VAVNVAVKTVSLLSALEALEKKGHESFSVFARILFV